MCVIGSSQASLTRHSGHDIFEGNVSAANLTEYESFRVSLILGTYVTPLVILPGLIGNTLSIMVASQRHNRKLPFGLCVGALAVADNAMLLFGMLGNWLFYHFLTAHMTWSACACLLATGAFCSNCGAWIIVILTFERYISVSKALSNPAPRSRRNTILVLCAIIVICLGKNLHYFFTAEFFYHATWPVYFCGIALLRSDNQIIALTVFELLFGSIVPFVFILTLNFIIIWKLRKLSYKRRLNEARKLPCAAHATAEVSNEEFKRNYETGSGMTAMLVSISIAFVVLTAPIFVNKFLFASVSSPLPLDITAEYLLLDKIFSVFFSTNFAINFYIYCVAAPSFRRDLKALWVTFTGIIPRHYDVNKITRHLKERGNVKLRSISKEVQVTRERSFTTSFTADQPSSMNQNETHIKAIT